ncbi:hypothetical protein U5B43_04350 [Campylobacter sp. 9BO]|uniref:hypothetical protein n=1 Tax=Campylobacter sp. 9BO TaxID=3424759 RepID=UPI003D32D852
MRKILLIFIFFSFSNAQNLIKQDLNMPIRPAKISKNDELKSYKFRYFGSYISIETSELLTIKEDDTFILENLKTAQQESGVFKHKMNEIFLNSKNFTAHKDHIVSKNGEFYTKLDLVKDVKGYKNESKTIIFTPFNDKAIIFITKNDGEILEKELEFRDGIYYFKDDKFLFLKQKAFVKNANFTAFDITWTISKGSVGKLSINSSHQDIIKIFGAKNIKRNKEQKDVASYDIYNANSKILSYTIFNNKISTIKTQNKNFKTTKHIGVGSSFNELKTAYKIEQTFINKDKIFIKIDPENIIFELENTSKNSKHIPLDAKIKSITINWL